MGFKFNCALLLAKTFASCSSYRVYNYSTVFLPTNIKISNSLKGKTKKCLSEDIKPYWDDILQKLLSCKITSFLNKDLLFELNSYKKIKGNCRINYCFVTDDSVAESIVSKILPYVKSKDSIVVECNPGFGLLTINLINSGVKKITIFEEDNIQRLTLSQMEKKYQDTLEIKKNNLLKSNFSVTAFLNLLNSSLELNRKIKIIGVIPNYTFFSVLSYRIFEHNLWDSINSTEFYVVISTGALENILNFKAGKYISYCLFNFIFDIEVLDEYPCTAFLPISKYYKSKMYLVKIFKKAECFKSIDKDSLMMYIAFLKILGRSRYNFIIETLEKWCPGCGPYVISKGISFSMDTQALSASESVKLFKFITEWEGYSNFKLLSNSFNISASNYR